MENTSSNNKQVVLVVLDGWGYREETEHNAIAEAKTPFFDSLWKDCPHTLLNASGLAVGLPEGQMGNSEIGHTTIGAGKIIDTDLVRIDKAIANNEFVHNIAFTDLFNHVKKYNSILHIQGLLSDGGVHSHSDHLFAFLRAAKEHGITNIAIHVFTDGRDTAPQSAGSYLEELERVVEEVGIGYIATASGRFFAMDRDKNFDRLEKAQNAIFHGVGKKIHNEKPSKYIQRLYVEGGLDEHIEPIVFVDDNGEGYRVKENDGVFIFNFRADRARMMAQVIDEKIEKDNICFVTMTEYSSDLKAKVAFPKIEIETTLAKEISEHGLTQAHIAETEKFPHATYFLNGGREIPHLRESHIMLPSRKDVMTHDLAPKMQAEGIANAAIDEIRKGTNFIFINFANPDMVGHTANKKAIVEAVEEVDLQLSRVITELRLHNGIAFITADHGNAEVNVDPKTGEKHTAHTINPVPAILTSKTHTLKSGTLADIAPTILNLFDIEPPLLMTGENLLQK